MFLNVVTSTISYDFVYASAEADLLKPYMNELRVVQVIIAHG